MPSSKGRRVRKDSPLKPLSCLVNMLALLMVLLLGAVSVHPEDARPFDVATVEAAHNHSPSSHTSDHSHLPGDAAVHCGAPILGIEPVSLSCQVKVASVVYFDQETDIPLSLAIEDLRPPRS
ncbi:hypothetical protein JEQ47_20085 [Devosia sp. MSA67]|jgi:hypothetical protein|uniref:Uncharacterized protein n=1 Tax=Devosia sediminis TaxID=2798801 RepID=A0A934IUM1_9HYPH|nr:hypothetical protein [Devosia sediminis]